MSVFIEGLTGRNELADFKRDKAPGSGTGKKPEKKKKEPKLKVLQGGKGLPKPVYIDAEAARRIARELKNPGR